ncbi:unnamed protein product [Cladocopium goreaui]|uniref:Vesicle transport protein USE1 n=1 Tax=Cladocopium goreaui TaxID=2562237 RepID=A0A9P1BSY2_9DINO|nr:unnamed protein product [Cladocopium goreaui]
MCSQLQSLHPLAAEFLLLLAHVENALKSGRAQEGCDWKIRKAKVASYELALRDRLKHWEALPINVAEQYRSRVEQLSCMLKKETPAAAELPRLENEQEECTSHVQKDPHRQAALSANVQEQNTPCFPRDVPWRRSQGHQGTRLETRPIATNGEARNNLESEMVDLAENMKGAANVFLQTLKKDNERLEDMHSSQQRSLDNVTAHSESGKKLLRSGQMSFFCTMILLAVSVVVFCMMIPFIVFT